MSSFLALSIELRLLLLFAVGTGVGAVVNWAAYALNPLDPRPISPWARGYPRSGLALWLDRVPLFGWLRARPEGNVFVEAGWLRPFVVELLVGLAFAALYVWQIDQLANCFWPDVTLRPDVVALATLHTQYLMLAVLIGLMFATSLVDLDVKWIPDAMTIPGTLVGLALSTLVGHQALVDIAVPKGATLQLIPLQFAAPHDWPAEMASGRGLVVALLGVLAWCGALLPRTWYARRGHWRAMQLCPARIAREPVSRWLALLAVVLELSVLGVWYQGGPAWQGLFNSIVGLIVGGAIVWSIRIMGSLALRREAMGFGDVILLAMIGTYMGWQPVLFAFFPAPFGGIVMGLFKLLFHGQHDLPYGPFLCLGTALTVIFWQPLWIASQSVFHFSGLIPGAMAVCLVLCGLLLWLMRIVRERVSRAE